MSKKNKIGFKIVLTFSKKEQNKRIGFYIFAFLAKHI